MQLNATCLVQVINFFVAYAVIRFLFIKPCMQVIAVAAEEQKKLTDQLMFAQMENEQEQKNREQLWQQFGEYAHSQVPVLETQELRHITVPTHRYQEPSAEEVTATVAQVSNDIVTHVRHAHEHS